jgi:hypothetical protein
MKRREERIRGPKSRFPDLWKLGWLVLLVAVGCGSSQVQVKQEYAGKRLPRPDKIFVYDFASSPDDVKTTKGVGLELEKLFKKAKPKTAKETEVGRKVAAAFSQELVKGIQKMGLVAERTADFPPTTGNHLLIQGYFLSIDQGNRTERVVIGFGAGRSDVEARVQIYESTPEGQTEVEQLKATAKSGRKPGMAEMMGVGAITGHLLTSTVVSGTVSAAGEASFETVEADARNLAKKVSKDLGQFFVRQTWTTASALK